MFKKITRSILWIEELLVSLFRYWIGNLGDTHRVVLFLIKKIKYIPMFLQRNIEPEHFKREFKDLINETVEIYKSVDFDPYSEISYKRLTRRLDNPYQMLYFLVRKLKPTQIVETGVAGGVSSGFILQAIKDNKIGKLYSIDLPFQWYSYGEFELHLDSLPTGKLPGYLIPEELKKNWKLIIGDTQQELPKLLKKLGKIDLFFHDSEHTYRTMIFEYNQAWVKLNKKGILVSDDIGFSKAFTDFVTEKNSQSFVFKQLGITFRGGK